MNPRTKKICDKCNKEISVSNFSKHYNACKRIIEDIKLTWKQGNMYKCPHCSSLFTERGIKFHIWARHTNPDWHPNKGKKGDGSKLKGRKLSQETKNKISKNNIWHTVKNCTSGNGEYVKCKWYNVQKPNGDICKVQGTYEKRFAQVLNILDKDWVKPLSTKQNLHLQWIDENNIEHSYFPDFWCPNLQKYFEVKGRYEENDMKKMKYILSHYNNVEMIFLHDIQEYEKMYINALIV